MFLVGLGSIWLSPSFKWIIIVVATGSECFKAPPDYTKNKDNEDSDVLPGKPSIVSFTVSFLLQRVMKSYPQELSVYTFYE